MSMSDNTAASDGKTMLKAICIASIIIGACSFAFYINIYLKSFSTSEGLLAAYMYTNITLSALEAILGTAGLIITRNQLRASFLIVSGIVLFTLNSAAFMLVRHIGSESPPYQGSLQSFILPVFYIIGGIISNKHMNPNTNRPFNGGRVFIWTTCIISILLGAYMLLLNLRIFRPLILRMLSNWIAPNETVSVILHFITATSLALEFLFGIAGLIISRRSPKAGYFVTTGAILCALNLSVLILGRYYLYISYMAFWSSLMGFVLPAFYIMGGVISKKLKIA